MAWKRNPITEEETFNTLRISPSSINTFNTCPRKWYHEYVQAITQGTSIHLLRGTVVHRVLEDTLKITRYPSGERFRKAITDKSIELLDKYWEEEVGDFEMDPKDKTLAYEESKMMVDKFFRNFCDKIQEGITYKIFESEIRGYYYMRPKFKEQWIDDQFKVNYKFRPILENKEKVPMENSLNVGGFIDSIEKDFDNNIILVDYKTSKKYKNSLSAEYVRQLAIYAYLYWKQQGKMPSLVAINYLRYGEVFFIKVTPSLIQEAIEDIKTMRSRITDWRLDEEKYYCKESKLCNWCVMNDTCGKKGKDCGDECKDEEDKSNVLR